MNLIETPTQLNRTVVALNETRGLIAKEMTYSPEFRKESYLSFLRGHAEKLQALINIYKASH